jgi:hypothetical protein
MSIYASNYIVDELTGEAKLVKHLNKSRIDRGAYNSTPGGWNKSGKKARQRKRSNIFNKRIRVYSKKIKMENF